MPVLHPPVEAPIVRPFHYAGSPFAAGLHRGIDFGSDAGEAVRAPCGGQVAWAGTGGITLVCGGRRVTLIGLAPAVGEGARARRGEEVGRAGEEPLHLGVRRPGDPFGYEDPERYLVGTGPSMPVVGPRPAPRDVRPAAPAREVPREAPAPRPAPRPAPAPTPAPTPAPAPVPRLAPAPRLASAPWLAWAGVAVALAGAFGAGVAPRARRRRPVRTQAEPVRAGPGGGGP